MQYNIDIIMMLNHLGNHRVICNELFCLSD